MVTAVKCGHCDGKGTCNRGNNWARDGSCDSCIREAGFEILNRKLVVTCSVCKGTGWAKLS